MADRNHFPVTILLQSQRQGALRHWRPNFPPFKGLLSDANLTKMVDEIGVWMTCPMTKYLQDELSKRFNLFKSWEIPSKVEFFNQHSRSIRALVGNGIHGADSSLIESLPRLEIISSHSSGLNQIDLVKCKEKGIFVTSTPDSLTDEVADLAVTLTLATLRRICAGDRFVRSGLWKQRDFKLTTKVRFFLLRLEN